MLCICCSVNGDQVTLLTSSIYKHMKRAATQLFKRQNKNCAFFRIVKLLLWFKTPRATPQARQRSENPTPGATRMCESPGVAQGVGQAWNCLSKGNKRSSTPQSFICNQLSTYSLKLKSYDRIQIILCIPTKWLGP